MQKPDDIPEDVDETAVRIAVDWAETQDAVEGLSKDIARAILAERERCKREFRKLAMAERINGEFGV